MTKKQQKFIDHYLGSLNATDAARQAGYSDPKNEGYRLLRHPEVAQVISEKMESHAMGAPEALARLGRIARGSMESFLEQDEEGNLRLTLASEWALANLDLVRSFKKAKFKDSSGNEKTYVSSIEFHDPVTALLSIMEHHIRARQLSSSDTSKKTPISGPGPNLHEQSVNGMLAELLGMKVNDLPQSLFKPIDASQRIDGMTGGSISVPSLEDAITLAQQAHRGQTDKAGAPYYDHLVRVMNNVDGEELKIIAVLHDTIKDSFVTQDYLKSAGYSERVIVAIEALTKRPGENDLSGRVHGYVQFIIRASKNPLARIVKMADLRDNMDLSRLKQKGIRITIGDKQRTTKYQCALAVLQALG